MLNRRFIQQVRKTAVSLEYENLKIYSRSQSVAPFERFIDCAYFVAGSVHLYGVGFA